MSNFVKQNINDFSFNPFTMIGKEWFLITAEHEGKQNTMTASWGGVGILFGKPVAYIFIRPQRYTKEFVDATSHFSLSVLPETYRKQLNYLGTVSGRTEDKITLSNLTIEKEENIPFFKEANTVFLCKKLVAQPIDESSFLDSALVERWYKEKDFHTMYIAEIESVLINTKSDEEI